MEIVRKVKDTEGSSNDSPASDYLREHVRSLSHRVKGLEQYKVLCEQRIKELFPNHPFPVKDEHLGMVSSVLGELQQAKQKISKLETHIEYKSLSIEDISEIRDPASLSSKYNDLIKEKISLEESLRNEMLICEEQRTYIEMLKQALEDRSSDSKVQVSSSRKSRDQTPTKINPKDLQRDFANLKVTTLDQASQIEKIQKTLQQREKEIEDIKIDKNTIEGHLKQAAESLQAVEEDLNRLEEEKNSLLDYIDEHSQKEQEMEKEMNDLSRLFEEMKFNYEGMTKKYEEESRSKGELEKNIQSLHQELSKSTMTIKEITQASSLLRSKIEEKDLFIKKLKEEKYNVAIKNESLLANVTTLSQTLKETQQEHESSQANVQGLNGDLENKNEEIFQLKSELAVIKQENEKLKEKIRNLDKDKKNESAIKVEVEKAHAEDKKLLNDCKTKIMVLEQNLRTYEEELSNKENNEKTQKLEINKLCQVQKDFITLKSEYFELQQREKNLSDSVEDLRQKNNELSSEIDRLYLENEKFSREILEKSSEIERVYNKLSQINEKSSHLQEENRILTRVIEEEKTNSLRFKDMILTDKDKMDREIRDYKDELDETRESLERKVRECEGQIEKVERASKSEINIYKQELSSKDLMQKNLETIIASLKEEVRMYQKTIEQKDLESFYIQNDITSLLSQISEAFSNNSLNENVKSLYPTQFKQYIYSVLSSTHSFSLENIQKYVENSVELIRFLSEIIFDLKDEVNAKNKELGMCLARVEGMISEADGYKQQIKNMNLEISVLSTQGLKDMQDKSVYYQQISVLKSELENIIQENHGLKMMIKNCGYDIGDVKNRPDISYSSLKTQESCNKFRDSHKSYNYSQMYSRSPIKSYNESPPKRERSLY